MQDPSTGESFAAKVVAKSTLEKERARQKILAEIRIHRGVSNPHVVRFVRCFEDDANVYILMELCSNKTLADVVKQRGGLSEREVACYAREIVARRRAPPRQPRHPPRPQTRKPLPHPRGARRGWRGTGFGPRPRGTRRRGPSEDWRFRTRVSPRSRRRAEDHHLRDAQLHRAGSVGRK